MSNLFSGINARIRGANKAMAPNKSPVSTPNELPKSHAIDPAHIAPRITIPESPSFSETIGIVPRNVDLPRPLPLWLNSSYAKHIVKGNFMTLSARPRTVEQGEWVAHQVVEHFRNLWNFVRIVHEKEEDGSSICNVSTCPKMSAGKNHSFTWLNRNHQPVEIPAHEYMTLMQRWISGKIDDSTMFPTDPAGVSSADSPEIGSETILAQNSEQWLGSKSGFPKSFASTSQLIFRQIFRVYAHLYWDHFIEPFYHLNLEKQLNSCFSHFILTATTLELLQPDELEPMQYLVDLWAADGTFPVDSKAYAYANVERGRQIMALSTGG